MAAASEGLYSQPGSVEDNHGDLDMKEENMVDIYVSAESLRVYDSPWMENASTSPAGPQPAVSFVRKISVKRKPSRGSVSLHVLCLLLLIIIVWLTVKMNKDKSSWEREREELLSNNTHLANNTDLR